MNFLKQRIEDAKTVGLIPYVATSRAYLDYIDLSIFGDDVLLRVMEDETHKNFHDAYVFSNFLAFGGSGVEMPNWVYVDCVLMQTAVFGFAVKKDDLPEILTEKFRNHHKIYLDQLDYVPVSGQTAALGIDGKTLVGFTLFSLRKYFRRSDWPALGILTKAMGLYALGADKNDKKFVGISQYNNAALKIHGRFCEKMYIRQAMMPLHPLTDLTMVYEMDIVFDEDRIFGDLSKDTPSDYDLLLPADDIAPKQKMAAQMAQGKKFVILPPYHIMQDGKMMLPLKVEG